MSEYRVVMHKHLDHQNKFKNMTFTVQKKGWFWWSTIQEYSFDGMWSCDKIFHDEQEAIELAKELVAREKQTEDFIVWRS